LRRSRVFRKRPTQSQTNFVAASSHSLLIKNQSQDFESKTNNYNLKQVQNKQTN
jgi:hypothetical protein